MFGEYRFPRFLRRYYGIYIIGVPLGSLFGVIFFSLIGLNFKQVLDFLWVFFQFGIYAIMFVTLGLYFTLKNYPNPQNRPLKELFFSVEFDEYMRKPVTARGQLPVTNLQGFFIFLVPTLPWVLFLIFLGG